LAPDFFQHGIVITIIKIHLFLPSRGYLDDNILSLVVSFRGAGDDVDMDVAQILAAAVACFFEAALVQTGDKAGDPDLLARGEATCRIAELGDCHLLRVFGLRTAIL
jgi:hypothetical protein